MVRFSAESPGPIRVEKHGRGPPLAAPVRRIFYLSAEGTMREHEVFPPPNPRLLAQVDCADAVVYGMGSLYTSICPSLVLKVWGAGTCTCPPHGLPLHLLLPLPGAEDVAVLHLYQPALWIRSTPPSAPPWR